MNVKVRGIIGDFVVELTDEIPSNVTPDDHVVNLMLTIQSVSLSLGAKKPDTIAAAAVPDGSNEGESYEATALVRKYNDRGEKIYRVKAGPWAKWGVPICPEVLAPFLKEFPGELPTGDDACEVPIRATALVELVDGKPKRVTSLRVLK